EGGCEPSGERTTGHRGDPPEERKHVHSDEWTETLWARTRPRLTGRRGQVRQSIVRLARGWRCAQPHGSVVTPTRARERGRPSSTITRHQHTNVYPDWQERRPRLDLLLATLARNGGPHPPARQHPPTLPR